MPALLHQEQVVLGRTPDTLGKHALRAAMKTDLSKELTGPEPS